MRLWMHRQRRWLLAALVLLLAVVLPGTGLLLALARGALVRSFGLAVDLLGIGLVLFLIVAFLAPLESLGWWAGWFGDAEERAPSLGGLAAPVAAGRPLRRWVVYLDGIGQASQQALPEGEEFLRRLAAALPDDIAILRGLMPYSITNQPLTEGRWLARFWRWVDTWRVRHPLAWLGLLVNLRNLTVVAVSADGRYGPIYNAGMAELIVDALLANGYAPGSGTPVTLLGFSGGGQISLGALPHLRRLLAAPVQVVSLGGVFAGNNRVLQAEHLFHLVGERDRLAPLGSILFPRRWPLLFLSPWNRALGRGRVSVVPLGPVGHELPGGLMDAEATLADGRTFMQQTVDLVSAIVAAPPGGDALPAQGTGNYGRFIANPWHRPDAARDLAPLPDGRIHSRPHWIGRLILPPAAERDGSVGFEVLQTPPGWSHCRGRRAALRWCDPALAQVTMDVQLSDEARDSARSGNLHPLRLDGWAQVTPLESLAGAHPHDDILVRLDGPVSVVEGEVLQLEVGAEPLQTAGLARALVRFVRPLEGDAWEALAFDPARGDFTGPPLRLRLPEPLANQEGILPATAAGMADSDLNGEGWLVSGVPDGQGAFVVQALLPRRLRRLAPQRVITQRRAAWRYARHQAWADTTPASASSVLVSRRATGGDALLAEWQEGDRLLVLHVFGGIGGEQREQALRGGLCTGHFAYGFGRVVREPLAGGELSVAVDYRQVYAHNPDGVVAGAQDRWRYLGERQWGWLGSRPVADILVRFPPFTGTYTLGAPGEERQRCPLDTFARQLTAMTARYRIGDGSGGSFVGPAHNCAQDSNLALFAAIRDLDAEIRGLDPERRLAWEQRHPRQAERLRTLLELERILRGRLLPIPPLRHDWQRGSFRLGSSLDEQPLRDLLQGLGSWRSLLPRLACETVLKVFLDLGASALVLRANQVGGHNPRITPVAPFTMGC
ncbi:MAG: CAAX protease [Cyanobium sp. PLM2.Bin73]|nr:MAG: CAAX protease [Cyanobium sp. PLM2.Bin73]